MPGAPHLFVISAPSGGGKTSLINALLQRDDRVALSVSHTTRPPRPGEQDGKHYYFVDEAEFEALVTAGAFLEHAVVFGNRYGTGRQGVERQLAAGYDVLLDIDWQGAQQVRASFPGACTVFVLPPSLEILRQRLTDRGQDSPEVIERRMAAARAEISHAGEFDFLIVNDDFDAALGDLHSIVRHGHPQRSGAQRKNLEILAKLLGNG